MRCKKSLCLFILPALLYILMVLLKDSTKTAHRPSMTFKWKSKLQIPGHSSNRSNRANLKKKSGSQEMKSQALKSLLFEKMRRDVKPHGRGSKASSVPQRLLDMWRINHLIVAKELHQLIEGGISFDDPRLISLIRRSTVSPSEGQLKTAQGFRMTPLEGAVDRLLQAKEYGFFLEANAFDGEGQSHTLWLERVRGWTGVLVEPDSGYFLQLIGKNRRAWAINTALSLSAAPSLVIMTDSERQLGVWGKEASGGNKTVLPAFPIASILASLGQHRLDLLSLDLREEEWSELIGSPWDAGLQPTVVAIQVMRSPEEALKFAQKLKRQGYLCHPEELEGIRHSQPRDSPRHILCMVVLENDNEYQEEFT